MEKKEQVRIYRKLYGYRSASNYGKYHYNMKGLLDTIPAIRYEDGNFVVREEDSWKTLGQVSEYGRIVPGDEVAEKLKIHSV